MASPLPWPLMAKGAIAKRCCELGDKCQTTVDEADRPACPSRAKIGSTCKWSSTEAGADWYVSRPGSSMGIQTR